MSTTIVFEPENPKHPNGENGVASVTVYDDFVHIQIEIAHDDAESYGCSVNCSHDDAQRFLRTLLAALGGVK